ncbi:MAG: DUF1553 domain-containing protein [Planctomyces sp.]|nr:DUF1553 domain-containing protein [Planctomyces sp.]
MTVDVKVGEHQSTVLFLIDPATGLPISSEETGSESGTGESRKTAWTFSKETASARVAAVFPKDLPVIDASVVAALDATGNTKQSNSAESVAQAVTSQNSGSGSEPTQASSGADGQNPGVASVTTIGHSTMTGAASQWKPVVVHPGMTLNPVRDLDMMLERLWQEHGVLPVNPATEEELLRRVYVDLAGRTPSVPEVRDYLRDTSPRKYELIVEKLLNSPDHSSHLAARFRSFLIPEGIDLANFGGIEAFEKWLAERFESGEPYDETVRSLLLAEGRLVQSGPLLFYSATKLEPDQLAGRTARVFLGMRLECAQCHDHPFEPWTQQDFWGFAAFFARISRPKGKLENVSTVMQVRDVNRGEVSMPESKDFVAPKFLNSTTDVTTDDAVARRKQLTDWLTGSENPYFARATVNRVWSMLFGKGIVEPVDDFGVGSPPLSPELIDLLAGQLIQSKFELRSLFRTIALSKAYRLSSGAEDVNEERQKWFAQMNVKMLTAEQVYDCITVATMPGTSATENVEGGLVARFGNSSREQFLRDFRTPSGRSTEYQGGIPQALTLMNGGLVDSATGLQSSGLLKSIEAPFFNTEQRLEILYFATLARPPKPAEQQMLDEYITDGLSGPELREALSDVLWALLNSAEFSMNH